MGWRPHDTWRPTGMWVFRIVMPFNFVWWHSIRRDYENTDLNFKHDFTIIQKLFGSHFISLFSDYLP